jgi:ABC-type uncharacterized transport system YnjBCD permease subunit
MWWSAAQNRRLAPAVVQQLLLPLLLPLLLLLPGMLPLTLLSPVNSCWCDISYGTVLCIAAQQANRAGRSSLTLR